MIIIVEVNKSGRIFVHIPKDFVMLASPLMQSVTTLYLPKKNKFEESADIENAPYIKGTLDVSVLLHNFIYVVLFISIEKKFF